MTDVEPNDTFGHSRPRIPRPDRAVSTARGAQARLGRVLDEPRKPEQEAVRKLVWITKTDPVYT